MNIVVANFLVVFYILINVIGIANSMRCMFSIIYDGKCNLLLLYILLGWINSFNTF